MRDVEVLYFAFPYASETRSSERPGEILGADGAVLGSLKCIELREPSRVPRFTKVSGARCSVYDADDRALWVVDQVGIAKSGDNVYRVSAGDGSPVGVLEQGVITIDGVPVGRVEAPGRWSWSTKTTFVSVDDGSELGRIQLRLGWKNGMLYEVRFATGLPNDLRTMLASYAYRCYRQHAENT